MKKLMIGSLMVLVLVLGLGLYWGQTKDLNASGTLSIDEMEMIKAGNFGKRCKANGSSCPSNNTAASFCAEKTWTGYTYKHEGESVSWCIGGGGGQGMSCGCCGLKCSAGSPVSCGQGFSATCSGGQIEKQQSTNNCGSLSTCS